MSWFSKWKQTFFKKDQQDNSSQDLSTMKLAELRSLAKEKGLKGYTSLRKAQLLELLQRTQ